MLKYKNYEDECHETSMRLSDIRSRIVAEAQGWKSLSTSAKNASKKLGVGKEPRVRIQTKAKPSTKKQTMRHVSISNVL